MIERKVFIFMLFLLFFIPINAKIDTERNQQIEYIESVLKLVESDIKPRNAGQTVKDAYRALKLSEKIGYQRGVIKAHYIIALSYFYSVEYKLAMQYVSKIETLKDVEKHSNLTPAEQQLCALSYLNFSTKEIAEYADIQISSVQARRSRLRKKINLETDIDFGEYLRGISFNDDY